VLGADVVMAHQTGLVDGQLDHALGARRQRRLAKGSALAAPDSTLYSTDNLHRLYAQFAQNFDSHPVFFPHQSQ